MIGSTLQNRYRLEAELGTGGMGTAYRAHDTLLDRDVAVKVLNDAGLGTEGRARLLREAQAVAQLNHPNIVAVHDAGEVDPAAAPGAGGQPYIVMELVAGTSLRDYPPRDIDMVLIAARQICGALDYAHSHDVMHGDLKPENVIVAVDGTVKLMDFGFARLLAFAEFQRNQMGIILPPPEQPYHDEATKILREALDEETLAQAWQAGGAMTLEQAMTLAAEPLVA